MCVCVYVCLLRAWKDLRHMILIIRVDTIVLNGYILKTEEPNEGS